MMALQVGQAEQEAAAKKVVAHSPIEKRAGLSQSFAASGVQN